MSDGGLEDQAQVAGFRLVQLFQRTRLLPQYISRCHIKWNFNNTDALPSCLHEIPFCRKKVIRPRSFFMESFVKDKASFCHLTNVDPNKLQDLETVLTTILALPIARDTFAQVIEGRPTRTPYSDEIKKSKDPFEKTIIIGDSVKPNHEAVQRFEEIRAAFKPQELTMDLKVRRLPY